MNRLLQTPSIAPSSYPRRAVPWQSVAVHFVVLATFLVSLLQIIHGNGISRWSVGIVYAGYDSFLILFTFSQILRSRHAANHSSASTAAAVTVVVACFNEANIIADAISAIQQQMTSGDRIILADDGSTDNLSHVLEHNFGMRVPELRGLSVSGPLQWLRLDHGGKSCALNQALDHIDTDMFMTVDADTHLHAGALDAMKQTFSRDPHLVAATGILRPLCVKNSEGVFFQFFQTYEYMRNFLSRSAWDRVGTLMLLSGAFSGYRTDAVKQVGGFDPTCIVEDYELTHRLLAHSYEHSLRWQTTIIGQARATTLAPGTFLTFVRQRKRWFSGFLQTHMRYRYMVGNPAYGRVGTLMLPVKAVDTLQPLFGMTGFLLLIYYILSANLLILKPILLIIACKLALDLTAVTAFLFIFDRWAGDRLSRHILSAWLATSAEPFIFQPLRHVGALWGWLSFLSGDVRWKKKAN